MSLRKVLLALLASACDPTLVTTTCVPGDQKGCPCPGGESGVQVCEPDGGSYGSCACGSGGSGGSTGGAAGSGGSGAMAGSGGVGGGACVPNAQAACYEGPPASAGVGTCKEGTTTCLPDGSGYGPCTGQVLPAPENCATAADEDCDGTALPCPASWTTVIGDAALMVSGGAVALGTDGTIVVAGSFVGTLTAGATTVTSPNDLDAFVMKLGPDGVPLWVTSLSAPQQQDVLGVAVHPITGAIAVAGATMGAVDFGAGPVAPSGFGDGCVWLLDAQGNTAAGTLAGGNSASIVDAFYSVTWDGPRVVATGFYAGASAVGAGLPLPNAVANARTLVLAMDGSAAGSWVTTFDGPSEYPAIFSSAAGLHFAGATSNYPFDVGQASPGPLDMAAVRIDGSSGALLPMPYAAYAPGADVIHLRAGLVPGGELVLLGTASGTTDWGFGVVPGGSIFVERLDGLGGVDDGTSFFAQNHQLGGISADASGVITATYGFPVQHDVLGTNLLPKGQQDLAIVRLDASFQLVSAVSFGLAGGFVQPIDQVLDPSGALVLLGSYSGALDFGEGALSASGKVFIRRFSN